MNGMIKKSVVSAGLALALATVGVSSASANTLELALVLDGSGSISGSDWTLQLQAYQNVFQDNFYTNYVEHSSFDQVVVSAYQFSSGVNQFIGWTDLTDDTAAFNFGSQFAGLTQMALQTNTSAAIDAAMSGLTSNAFDGKLVIDISTDGVPCCSSNSTSNAYASADAARAAGATINAVGVGSVDTTFLDNLTSPSGFYMTASDFAGFESALRTKLGKETQVPEPSVLLLFGVGLLGLGVIKRCQRNV